MLEAGVGVTARAGYSLPEDDSTGGEERLWVDAQTVDAHFEVQMTAGRGSGRADEGDRLASDHRFVRVHDRSTVCDMRIDSLNSGTVVDEYPITVRSVRSCR